MTPEQFRKAEEVFQAACVLPAGDRTAFVENACAGDTRLLTQVNRLLEHDRKPGVVIDTVMGRAVRSASERLLQHSDSPVPKRIGAYKILRQIGEGGFGVVYLAEQERPRRTVALKVVRWTAASRDALKRFEHETQILGQLQHAGIAQIFEAGVADVSFDTDQAGSAQDSVPYYAMEYIQGKNLLDYAASPDANRPSLGTPDRLELIARVCDALQHAHQNGIIHRDLKPDNILVVDSAPSAGPAAPSGARQFGAQPKLLDFGIARALESDASQAIRHTSVGQLVGTPAYMSPEQVRGDPNRVDTRSDIYTVGVLLYQLLAGRMPYDFGAGSMMEIIRAIEEQSPSSLRTAGGTRTGRINADVDAIVAKALCKEPDRRYQTAEALASDIRSYLANEPIEAKRDSTLYVLRKQLRKYRGIAVASLLLILSLVAFAVYASFKARSERLLAEAAVSAQHLAESHKARADEKSKELARSLYFSNIGFAHAALESNDVGRARQLLEACPPDLRNWEYYFLSRLSDRSIAQFTGLNGPTSFAADNDGERLFVGRKDGSIRVLDLSTFRERGSFMFESCVTALALSPDGTQMAIACEDGRIDLYDAETGALQETLQDSTMKDEAPGPVLVGAVAFSPDGSLVLSGGVNGLIRAWRVSDGAHLYHKSIDGGRVFVIRFTRDGTHFVAAGTDGAIRLCNARSGEVVHTFSGHRGIVRILDISPDGRTLATGGDDTTVRLWDLVQRRQIASLLGHRYQIYSVHFDPDGKRLISGCIDHTARLWDVPNAELMHVLRGHTDEVRYALFVDHGRKVLSFGRDGVQKLWSVEMAADVPAVTVDKNRRTITTTFSSDGTRLLAASGDGTLRVWKTDTLDPSLVIQTDDSQTIAAAFSPDCKTIASGGTDKILRLWDAATESKIWQAPGHEGHIFSVAFSPDGSRIVSCDAAGDLRGWARSDAAPLFESHDDRGRLANCVAFSPDGQRLAVSGGDARLEIRNANDGTILAALAGHTGIVSGVTWSPDGSTLASVADDGILKIWDAMTLQLLRSSPTHQGPTFGVCFNPDGTRIATGGYDHTLRIWNADTCEEILTLRGHSLMVGRLAFSPDGSSIASTSEDGTIRLWQASHRDRDRTD